MATNRRIERVASMIKREVSLMLLNGIKDDRVGAGMVSVTEVIVSGDLQHTKVFVSIYGTDEAKAETMEGLKSATSYVRNQLGQRLQLRRTPGVAFLEDGSLERGDKMVILLNQLSADRKPGMFDDEELTDDGEKLTNDDDDDDDDDDLEADED